MQTKSIYRLTVIHLSIILSIQSFSALTLAGKEGAGGTGDIISMTEEMSKPENQGQLPQLILLDLFENSKGRPVNLYEIADNALSSNSIYVFFEPKVRTDIQFKALSYRLMGKIDIFRSDFKNESAYFIFPGKGLGLEYPPSLKKPVEDFNRSNLLESNHHAFSRYFNRGNSKIKLNTDDNESYLVVVPEFNQDMRDFVKVELRKYSQNEIIYVVDAERFNGGYRCFWSEEKIYFGEIFLEPSLNTKPTLVKINGVDRQVCEIGIIWKE